MHIGLEDLWTGFSLLCWSFGAISHKLDNYSEMIIINEYIQLFTNFKFPKYKMSLTVALQKCLIKHHGDK